ncbi:MAG: hypothetical protein WA532_02595 [Candidatus Korobacteraceae bacterium]
MKKIVTLGTLLLGCCLMTFAQTGSQDEAPQGAPPSGSPQVQTPSEQAVPPAEMPPDTSAAGQGTQEQAAAPANQSGDAQVTTVQGCLSQSANGFMLADNVGNNYQLSGDTSKLAGLVGKEVRVSGMTIANGGQDPGAMSSDDASADSTSVTPEAYAQISVSRVRKIANVCSAASATGK